MFDNVEYMQNWGLTGEGLCAAVGGFTMTEELGAFEGNVFKPVGGLKGATTAGVFTIATDEATLRVPGGIIEAGGGWDVLNSAESAAELENEMAANLSESTCQTIQSLQAILRTMLDAYDKNCRCKK